MPTNHPVRFKTSLTPLFVIRQSNQDRFRVRVSSHTVFMWASKHSHYDADQPRGKARKTANGGSHDASTMRQWIPKTASLRYSNAPTNQKLPGLDAALSFLCVLVFLPVGNFKQHLFVEFIIKKTSVSCTYVQQLM